MIWSGEYVFGRACAAFHGSAADNAAHDPATIQIVLALPHAATVARPDGTVVTGHCLLVRPGASHTLRPIEHVTLIFLEPKTAIARRLLSAVMDGDIVELLAEFAAPFSSGIALADALAEFERFDASNSEQIDPRVDQALAFMIQADGARVVARAASAVGLSTSQMRALAQAHLDTPLTA